MNRTALVPQITNSSALEAFFFQTPQSTQFMMAKTPFQGLMWTLTSTPTKEGRNVRQGSENPVYHANA
jgi:hypothetical protein